MNPVDREYAPPSRWKADGVLMTGLGLPDGTPTHMTTGEPVSIFGNTPLVVSGGVLTNSPVDDQPPIHMAGYAQAALSEAHVGEVWASVIATDQCNTSLALVIPTVAWAHRYYPAAEVHAVFEPCSGRWHVAPYDDRSGEGPTWIRGRGPRWNDGHEHLVGVRCRQDGTLEVMLPDASSCITAPGAIATDRIGEFGIVEIYRRRNRGSVSLGITAWGLSPMAPAGQGPATSVPSSDAREDS